MFNVCGAQTMVKAPLLFNRQSWRERASRPEGRLECRVRYRHGMVEYLREKYGGTVWFHLCKHQRYTAKKLFADINGIQLSSSEYAKQFVGIPQTPPPSEYHKAVWGAHHSHVAEAGIAGIAGIAHRIPSTPLYQSVKKFPNQSPTKHRSLAANLSAS